MYPGITSGPEWKHSCVLLYGHQSDLFLLAWQGAEQAFTQIQSSCLRLALAEPLGWDYGLGPEVKVKGESTSPMRS